MIVSLVTPSDVAPPLLSPFFNGRVHGARCWYGYASVAVGSAVRRVLRRLGADAGRRDRRPGLRDGAGDGCHRRHERDRR